MNGKWNERNTQIAWRSKWTAITGTTKVTTTSKRETLSRNFFLYSCYIIHESGMKFSGILGLCSIRKDGMSQQMLRRMKRDEEEPMERIFDRNNPYVQQQIMADSSVFPSLKPLHLILSSSYILLLCLGLKKVKTWRQETFDYNSPPLQVSGRKEHLSPDVIFDEGLKSLPSSQGNEWIGSWVSRNHWRSQWKEWGAAKAQVYEVHPHGCQFLRSPARILHCLVWDGL